MEMEISLNDLRFYSYHGVYAAERSEGNEFIVSVSVRIPYADDKIDDLDVTISYADLFEIVEEEMNSQQQLLETVALRIKNNLKRKFPQIRGGWIKIEKKRPPIKRMLGTASVKLIF